ncbi:MAG: hypothetical protein AAFR91_09755 [Pseudomonadota bacterium]
MTPPPPGFPRWTRSQETSGTYRFDGRSLMTAGVRDTLDPVDIIEITHHLHEGVRLNDGLDYLQVFKDKGSRVVWAIDDGTHWTLLLPSEY